MTAPSARDDTAASRRRFTYRREYRGPVQAVILDWAGTTQDHGVFAPATVFVDLFRARGIEISMAQARRPMGLYKLDHIRAITRDPDAATEWRRVHGVDCTEDDVLAMFEEFKPMQEAAVARHAGLIRGTVEVVAEMRRRGCLIGSTTGYTRSAAEIAAREASRQGYEPDAMVCADEVPAGRPEPWMVLRNMELLRVFPPAAVVKIGDTLFDVDEGINAGTWTVGLSRTGNYVGLSEADLASLDPHEQRRRVVEAEEMLRRRGAHYVVETIADVLPCLDDIEDRLHRGEGP